VAAWAALALFAAAAPPARTDRYGDPLPPGVLVRLGTPRLCHPDAHWLAFSPDGRKLASMDPYQLTVRVWDVKTGEQIGQFGPDQSNGKPSYGIGPSLLAFSPGGELLAAVCRGDGNVRLWDVKARQLLHTIRGNLRFGGVPVFAPDGRRLVVSGSEGTLLIDPAKGEALS
jgi:WD40 repeat protein